jgi:aspartate-semialdehyde dehydrogenase
VGQKFVRRLSDHPWFELRHLTASDRNVGRAYGEACAWHEAEGEPYGGLAALELLPSDPGRAFSPLVFSALDTGSAREIEPAFAAAGALVFSNAAAFRMEVDVPLLVPEVNGSHLGLLEVQRRARGWTGGLVTNPNCTTTVLVMALAPLQAAFGIEAVHMTSLQALSGAGYPGVPSLDILGNVIPFIRGEEAKVEEETPRLLGTLVGDGVRLADLVVSAHCNRVPVLEGHTESVSVRLRGDPDPDHVREALRAWNPLRGLGLPSAPAVPIHVHGAENRPQVRLDAGRDGGMSIHVGRIRRCPLLGIKFTVLGSNTERGAAGASVLNAEWTRARTDPSRHHGSTRSSWGHPCDSDTRC